MASDPSAPTDRPSYPSPPMPYERYPQYAPYPQYGPYPPEPTTNVLAIVGFVASFVVGLAGIICGHIALSQIRRTGEKGRGLALAATIIGYVQVAFAFMWTVAVLLVVVLGSVAHTVAASSAAPPSSNTDCVTLETAAQTLSNSLTNLAASAWRSAPADAKDTLVEAWTRFEDQTSTVADLTTRSGINAEDDDLSAVSTALVDYQAAAPGQGDQAAVEAALATAAHDLRALTSTCG